MWKLIFPLSLLTGEKTSKTKHNYNQEIYKKALKTMQGKLLAYAQTEQKLKQS